MRSRAIVAFALITAFAGYLLTVAATTDNSLALEAQAHEPPPAPQTGNESPPATATGTPAESAKPTAAPPHDPATTAVAPGETPDGLDADEWGEIQQQIDADQRSFRRDTVNNTWHATHAATGIEAEFAATGEVTVHGSESTEPVATVQLAEWGPPDAPQSAAAPAVVEVTKHRLAYHRENLIEWYDNKPGGIMHGFTVPKDPCNSPHELRFALALDIVAALRCRTRYTSAVPCSHVAAARR